MPVRPADGGLRRSIAPSAGAWRASGRADIPKPCVSTKCAKIACISVLVANSIPLQCVARPGRAALHSSCFAVSLPRMQPLSARGASLAARSGRQLALQSTNITGTARRASVARRRHHSASSDADQCISQTALPLIVFHTFPCRARTKHGDECSGHMRQRGNHRGSRCGCVRLAQVLGPHAAGCLGRQLVRLPPRGRRIYSEGGVSSAEGAQEWQGAGAARMSLEYSFDKRQCMCA